MNISEQNRDLSEFERLYREKRYLYEDFARDLRDLMEKLIKNAGIPFDKVVYRTKDIESFLKKIVRKVYDDPFEQIKDFAGVRVITYYQDDAEKVIRMIRAEFEVDEAESVDKVNHLSANEFGYRSVHLIVSLSQNRAQQPEWKRFAGLWAEIQVRSVLQDAWADLSHRIDYKITSQAPTELRRRLFRLSALLELADEEFTEIRDLSEVITKGYRDNVSQGRLDLPVNLDSLEEFIEQKVDLQKWAQFGVEAGMQAFPEIEIDNKYKSGRLGILLRTLQETGITTIAGFEAVFPDFEQRQSQLQRFVELVKAAGKTVYAVPLDVLILLVSFAKADAIPPDFNWGGRYRPFIIEALRKVCREQAGA